MIWDLLIEKRVVSLAYDRVLNGPVQVSFAKKPPSFVLPSPLTLSICSDSRDYAKSKGYRHWNLLNSLGKTHRFMFSPDLDTISFVHTPSLGFHPDFLLAAFPDVILYVKQIAVSSDFWRKPYPHWNVKNDPLNTKSMQLWDVFKSLTDVWVVFEPDYESDHSIVRDTKGWHVPRDIQDGYEKEKMKDIWKDPFEHMAAPRVRIVLDESDIIEGTECCLVLRSIQGYETNKSLCKYVKERRGGDDW